MEDELLKWIDSKNDDDYDDSEELKSDDIKVYELDVKKYDIVYNWEPLSIDWRKKLLSNDFYVMNCLGDGNCQFRAIATALLDNTDISRKMTHDDIRTIIAKYIRKLTIIEFRNILDLYKLEYKNKEFKGKWDPLKVKTKKEFITYLLRGGFEFEGDNITLSIISAALSVDFVIFDNNSMNILDLTNYQKPNKNMIILYYDNNHYQTIGYKCKEVKSFLERSVLPKDIRLVLDKQKLLTKHCEIILTDYQQLNLNSILNKIYENSFIPLDLNDKKDICKFIKSKLKK